MGGERSSIRHGGDDVVDSQLKGQCGVAAGFSTGCGLLGLGSSALVLVRSWRQTSPCPPFRRYFSALGTRIQLTVSETPTQVARVACKAVLEEMVTIHRLMSTHERESQLSRVNRQAGCASLEVDGRLVEVIRESLKWSRLSRGVFDLTILPLLRAWGLPRLPIRSGS